MYKFISYIVFIPFLIIGILILLDCCYTSVYDGGVARTKIQYLRGFKNKKIDFIFIGSSRVENGIIPKLISDKTDKSAVNLGFQASKMSDILTILKLIKEYNISFSKVFIQVDYIYNIKEGHSNVLEWQLIPFINENQVTRDYFNQNIQKDKILYTIPFYRYCTYESKIGFREFFLNGINKKTSIIQNFGFVPLYGNSLEHHNSLPPKVNNTNEYFEKIKLFVQENDLKVVYFCAPFCSHTKNLAFIKKLKKRIPELNDFSDVIANDSMFQNCSHLNIEGAKIFTNILIEKMLKDK